MAGLLDMLNLGGGLTGAMSNRTPGINPAAPDPYYQMFGIDPEQVRRDQIRRSLMAISTGLLSGNNWKQGAASAMQGLAGVSGQAEQEAFKKGMMGLEFQRLQKSMEPEPGWTTLTPEQAADKGLPPDRVWQQSPDGEVKAAYTPEKPEQNKPVFQDFIAPGGVKIPRVSYDGGFTWQDMTTGGGPQQGGGMKPFDAILSNETGGLSPAAAATAVSPAGAIGRAQMLPGTFNQMASQAGIPGQLRSPTNPKQSEAMGARYYGQQVDRFNDPVLAAGAYHAGEGNMKAYMQKAGYYPGMPTDQLIQNMKALGYTKTADYMEKFANKTGMGGVQRVDYSQYAKPDQTDYVGTIPEGKQLIRDPQTGALRLEDIPGSKQAVAAETAKENQGKTADAVLNAVSDIRKNIKEGWLPTTGLGASQASMIPGTSAYNVKSAIMTIKSNISIDKLQAMRNASPTGGAVGNVTEGELALLSATISNLDQSQSKEQFEENLKEVEKVYDEIINGPPAAKKASEMTDEELKAYWQ